MHDTIVIKNILFEFFLTYTILIKHNQLNNYKKTITVNKLKQRQKTSFKNLFVLCKKYIQLGIGQIKFTNKRKFLGSVFI